MTIPITDTAKFCDCKIRTLIKPYLQKTNLNSNSNQAMRWRTPPDTTPKNLPPRPRWTDRNLAYLCPPSPQPPLQMSTVLSIQKWKMKRRPITSRRGPEASERGRGRERKGNREGGREGMMGGNRPQQQQRDAVMAE